MAGLTGVDEKAKDCLKNGLYQYLAKTIESLVRISRSRQFFTIPAVVPPVKVSRLLPEIPGEDVKNPIDLLQTSVPSSKIQQIDMWSRKEAAERLDVIMQKMKQEETRGKPKKGKEKNQRYDAIKAKKEKDLNVKMQQIQTTHTEEALEHIFRTSKPTKQRKDKGEAEMYFS